MAWDDAATRRAIGKQVMSGLIRVVVGVGFLLLLFLVVREVLDRRDRLDERLDEVGQQTTGVVVDVSSGFLQGGRIDVRFGVDGVTHVEQIDVDREFVAVFEVGDEIEVTYDPKDPSVLRTLLGEPAVERRWLEPVVSVVGSIGVLFGLAVVVLGLFRAFMATRWRGLARREQWRSETILCRRTTWRVRRGLNLLNAIVLCQPNGPNPQLCGVVHGGRGVRKLEEADHAWILGKVEQRAMIAVPGPEDIFRTITPPSPSHRARWLAEFSGDDLRAAPADS